MIRFECDYAEGAHPRIMEALSRTNFEQSPGYATDSHSDRARALIRNACEAPEAEVQFLVGGTQANSTIIAAALRPWQGVLCAETGHINVHETGAVEATGHKVLPLPQREGKITAAQVEQYCSAHWNDANHEHIVQPGMVYISLPTEYGTLYTREELTALYAVCRRAGLPLFVDGARLGYGLAAASDHLTLPELAHLCDVFYIGGTKVGALFGEAVVIVNEQLKKDFRYIIKQRGGMLAKGRLLGVQFETMFEDGLYMDMSRHAIAMADILRQAFQTKGVEFLIASPTNQLFPLLTPEQEQKLAEKYAFCFWEKVPDGRNCVRFCTSWATTEENTRALAQDILNL